MDIIELNNALKTDYPSLNGVQPCESFARLLNEDISGMCGEVTAVMQYSYQSFIVEQYEEEIYHILEKIAQNEMMHMEVLSAAVLRLGGDPVYNGGGGQYWNAGSVNYCGNLIAMMNANIQGEKYAIANYRKRITQTSDKCLCALIERIIKDEQLHLSIFEEIKCWAMDRSNMHRK